MSIRKFTVEDLNQYQKTLSEKIEEYRKSNENSSKKPYTIKAEELGMENCFQMEIPKNVKFVY